MRVLAGRYKSKLIRTINDPLTRPMMSKVRESIFNSLQFNIENKDILDLYAGSGSLGIESLSRGANFVTFIENSDDCITILKQNLKEFENNYKITKSSVDKFFDEQARAGWAEKSKCESGDLLLIMAGEKEITRNAIGVLRLHLGEKLGLRDPEKFAPLWIVDLL